MRVKATRVGLYGRRTAGGLIINTRQPFVALPSTRALYRFVWLRNPANGTRAIALVGDVGPWNEHDDPYVFGGARPAAERGIDERGRETNEAGIDLSDATWRALEMRDNTIIEWGFLEESAMRYRVHVPAFDLELDLEPAGDEEPRPPAPPPPGGGAPPPPPARELPRGFDVDETVAAAMLLETVDRHRLDPIAMQGHGAAIAAALNADWPGLEAYAHKQSDAIMWPGFGSIDVTKDSGKGGWYFRPDRQSRYGEGRP